MSRGQLPRLGPLAWKMDPDHFTNASFGTVTREPGSRHPFWYFLPKKLPREINLGRQSVLLLSEADAALGVLNGLGRLIREPELLVGPYLTREAVASSRIEGTQASLSDVLKSEASETPTRSEEIAEVERYIAATQHGYDGINTLPLTFRLIKEMLAILLAGVRGADKLPGDIRRSPVWIGSTDDSPDTATFVPPVPGELPEVLADWEDFVNNPSGLPVLVRCALMHYQFETIHPFLDGNGRIGRALINLLLLQEGRLSRPLLYLSGYLEARRSEYYDRLQAVRERGEVEEWIQFFLAAVKNQAEDAVSRASDLVDLRERYLEESSKTRSSLSGLVRVLFVNPYMTVGRAERALGLTNAGARNVVRDAQARGWLQEIGTSGRGGKTFWVAGEVLAIIESSGSRG